MTPIVVDSNVLLDVFGEDPVWGAWSRQALAQATNATRVVINPVIYAEASVRFTRIEECEEALPSSVFSREPIPYEAAFLAGKIYVAYRRRGGHRPAPLPDFFIGAHAQVAGYRLLTRDPGRYRANFPKLPLITPS